MRTVHKVPIQVLRKGYGMRGLGYLFRAMQPSGSERPTKRHNFSVPTPLIRLIPYGHISCKHPQSYTSPSQTGSCKPSKLHRQCYNLTSSSMRQNTRTLQEIGALGAYGIASEAKNVSSKQNAQQSKMVSPPLNQPYDMPNVMTLRRGVQPDRLGRRC